MPRQLQKIDKNIASFTSGITTTATGIDWDDIISINTGDLSEAIGTIDLNGTYSIFFTANTEQTDNNSKTFIRILIDGVVYSPSVIEEGYSANDKVAPIATSAYGSNIAKAKIIKVQAQVSSGTATFENGLLTIAGHPDTNNI